MRHSLRRPRILLVKSCPTVSKFEGVTPPLGLLYLAASARDELGAEVRIVDPWWTPDLMATVREAVASMEPDVVGISALTFEAVQARRIAAAAREVRPDVAVVIGGPYPSATPDEATADPCIDVAVLGEGERTFNELVRLVVDEGARWRDPALLRSVRGIAFADEGACVVTEPRPPIEDLDALPFPAWDLLDYRRYWTRGGMSTEGARPYLTMFTSRGCPFRCVFCHNLFGKQVRNSSPERVADEVARIRGLGATHIEVLDDIVNLRRESFDRMLETLLGRDLHPVLSFPNGVRADLLREESLDLLKRVGVGEVSVAVETASERLQKLIRKNLDLDRVRHVIGEMADRRILTRGFFMLGLPTETIEEMRATIRFAHRSRLHMALFFSVNPYRNTEMYRMFEAAGKLPAHVDTRDFQYYGAPFNGSEVPEKVFKRLYRWAYFGFYLNPVRAFRIARDRPCRSDLLRNAFRFLGRVGTFQRTKATDSPPAPCLRVEGAMGAMSTASLSRAGGAEKPGAGGNRVASSSR